MTSVAKWWVADPVVASASIKHQRRKLSVLPVQVSLLLPGCSSTPNSLEDVLKSFSSFYLLKNLPAHELLDKEFLETAVYQGKSRQRAAEDTPDIRPKRATLHCLVCRQCVRPFLQDPTGRGQLRRSVAQR